MSSTNTYKAALTGGAAETPRVTPVIRPMGINDGAFVLDSWCRSYMHSPDMEGQDPDAYKIEMRNFLYALIPKCKTLVATAPGDSRSILGWACAEAPREAAGLWVLQYVLVRPEYQRQGIATALTAPFRAASPNGMLWAAHYTRGLRKFGTDFLIVNKFLNHRIGAQPKPHLVGGIAAP